ncbi:hypothetical protein GCM10027430_06480 [Lysobacter tyrosinilyticus]
MQGLRCGGDVDDRGGRPRHVTTFRKDVGPDALMAKEVRAILVDGDVTRIGLGDSAADAEDSYAQQDDGHH